MNGMRRPVLAAMVVLPVPGAMLPMGLRTGPMSGMQAVAPRPILVDMVVLEENEDLIFHAHHASQIMVVAAACAVNDDYP